MSDNIDIIVQDTINDIIVNSSTIVETIDISVEASVEEVTIISNPNDYIININKVIGEQVQSDWDVTIPQDPAYIKNKPTIPDAQVNSDWNATTGIAEILNKPTIPTQVTNTSELINDGADGVNPFITAQDIPAGQVNSDWNATSGVAEILNKPTIPAEQVNSDWNATSGKAQILNKPTIPSISGLATITYVDTQDALKVDKIAGKGLSTNDFTNTLKTKLDGIQDGAEVNVNADWNAVSGDAQILNKPTIPSIAGLATITYVDTQDALKVDKVAGKGLSTNDFTNTLKTKLDGIQDGAEVNVNADWNATSGDAQILNKPTIPDTSTFVPYTGATADVDLNGNDLYLEKLWLNDPVNSNNGSVHFTDGNFHIEDGDGHPLLVVEDEFVQIHKSATIQSNLWTNGLSATRDHYLPNQSGTIALTSDITGTNSGVNTGDETTATIKSKLGITTLSGSNTGDQDLSGLVPNTRTINTKALSSDVTLTTADIADSTDKRYVTDANLTTIGNQSGTNTGDNATNSQYSGLATSKQDTLVSGTNIKTINGNSVLGSGDLVVSGGGSTPIDIQLFTSSGVWTKPAGASYVEVYLVSGGGGGGSGRRGATSTARYGGGGGSSGAITSAKMNATNLGATENIWIGTGGNGGAAIAVNDTNGATGSSGLTSNFGGAGTAVTAKISTSTGIGGAGGSNVSNSGSSSFGSYLFSQLLPANSYASGSVGASGFGGGISSFILRALNAGSYGGGLTAVNVPTAGQGNRITGGASAQIVTTAFGGAVGSNGDNGSFVTNSASNLFYANGGAGGGSGDILGTIAGGTGGNGATGAGGAGGGASTNGANSGAGGRGGDGFCMIVTYF